MIFISHLAKPPALANREIYDREICYAHTIVYYFCKYPFSSLALFLASTITVSILSNLLLLMLNRNYRTNLQYFHIPAMMAAVESV